MSQHTPAQPLSAAGTEDRLLVRRSLLPGGVRVVSEHMPGLRSATLGVWIGVGSRDEADGHLGSTHFLEHLLFKGTGTRSALDIATAFDEVGGDVNAITSKEYTCYYARVLDVDVPMATDVLTDMVTSATLDEQEMASERGVILEELAMNDDDPSDVVHERFAELVMGAHPLGRPIGGTPQAIRDVPRDAVWEHYRTHYRPDGLIITAAGGIDHDRLCADVVAALAAAGWPCAGDAVPLPPRIHGVDVNAQSPAGATQGSIRTVNRPTEQAHLVLGGLGILAADSRRFTLSVLSTVLGGGMSSRLFQEVREKRGLAYSVYSFASGYADSGYYGMYAGCTPSAVAEVVDLLQDQLESLAAAPVSADELRRAKGQLCGGMVLGMEDSGSRMSRLGKAELVYGELVTLDDALARVGAVTAEDVQQLAAELAGRPRS
ncbi:MAG: peptidase M16, partial [Micrococcales bacterium]